jgi:hypothetical protein
MKHPFLLPLLFVCHTASLFAAPVDSIVVFNELHYNPAGTTEAGEFIELHNQNGIRVDLSDWRLSGGVEFTFPDGTIIEGKGYLVIRGPLTTGLAGSFGPWTGSLGNGGETIRLRDKNDRLLDELNYGDAGSWPIGPDGGGVTLAKIQQDSASGSAANWTSSSQLGGTPGAENFPPPPSPITARVVELHTPWRFHANGTDLGTTWTAETYNDAVAGWSTGTAAFDFGSTVVYGEPTGPPPSGNQEITGITIAARSSEATGSGLGRAAVNTINGSGLTNGRHGTTATNTMWLTNGTVLSPQDPLPAQITFDLGSTQNLTQLKVWNYNEAGATNRGARAVEILVAATAGGTFTSVGTFNFTQASGATTEAGFDIPFVQNGVRQVQLNITTNWGAASNYVGLAEVKFFNDQPATPPAPPVYTEKISVLPSSGMNADGTPRVTGQRDPNYVSTANNLGAITQVGNPAWLAEDNLSRWLGPTASGSDSVPAATYTYRLSPDFTYWNRATANIKLYVSADNSLDSVLLNGTTLAGVSGANFNAYSGPFTITGTTFNAGANTMDFVWTNAGPGDNPGGLRVRWDATGEPILRRTSLAASPTTSYFRKKFTWQGNPAASYNLSLTHLLDDGAVFYLNGSEVLRTNLPSGTISASTTASAPVLYPKFSSSIAIPAGSFHVGENTLAVELHQAATGAADALFGMTLTLTETPPAAIVPPTVRFHELASAAAPFFVELHNYGSSAVLLSGMKIASQNGQEYPLSGSLAPGQFLSLAEATVGFRPLDGDRLFLRNSVGIAVLDAVVVKNAPQARLASGAWQTPSAATPGTTNTFSINADVVINEILYHHIPTFLPTGSTADPEEWVELYNKGTAAVNLTNWKMRGDADFTFPANTIIPAGGYLVIAKDPASTMTRHAGLTALGPWTGTLPNSTGTVRLVDVAGNTVDEVTYFDKGRWDWKAGGNGSSLELLHPSMDNTQPEAWAGSDETNKSTWQTFTVSGLASVPPGSNDPTSYNEFILGLLAAGECLVDDVSVLNNSVELIQDGSFSQNNVSKWRLLGTHGSHGRSVVASVAGNPALKLVATGASEHMHNHAETTLKNGSTFHTINAAQTYNISFRARWQAGCPRINSRLYFNRLNRQFLLPVPMQNGTPGAANTKLIANPAPIFSELTHFPIVPTATQPVTVSVAISSPAALTSVQLRWKLDGASTPLNVPMALGTSGKWTASIPGQVAGALASFQIAASTGAGGERLFPSIASSPGALVAWSNGQTPNTPGHILQVLMPTATADFMHLNTNVMSNDYLPCTVIYKGSEAFYFAGARLKSSQRGRLTDSRLGFAVSFDPTQKFRGAHEGINLDRSAYGPGTTGGGTGQVDIINQIFAQRAGGVTGMYNDMVYFLSPRTAHHGSAQLTMAEFNDVYLDSQWENGADSPTFKFDLIYFPTSTAGGGPEGLKIANPDDVRGVNIGQLTGTSKEDYRWHYLIGNARTDDDYTRLQFFDDAFAQLAAGNSTNLASAIDIDQWLRASAAMALVNSNDSYSTGGLPHNLKLYVRPRDGRVLYLPWDADFAKQATNFPVEGNADLQRIIAVSPVYRRQFYGHLHDIINTSYNTAYLTPWVNHISTYNTAAGDWQEILTYVAQRVAFVQSDCATKFPTVAFAITTNSGADFSTNQPVIGLSGNAWIDVRAIRLAGVEEPLLATFTGSNGWQVQLPIEAGANTFVLEALNYQGQVVGTDTITITGSGTVIPAAADNLVISEMHYHPANPTTAEIAAGFTDADDFEYLEFQNISPSTVDLSGCRLESGLTYTFATGLRIGPGETRILPRRSAAFALRHPGVATLAQYYLANGNTLSNGGEEIALLDAAGSDIKRFTYNDSHPWPVAADGQGPSMVLIAPRANPEHREAFNWRASFAANGSPNSTDALPRPAQPLADTDGDGLSNLVDYATGETLAQGWDGALTVTFERDLRADASVWPEVSGELQLWNPNAVVEVDRVPLGPNRELLVFQLDPNLEANSRLFLRFLVR